MNDAAEGSPLLERGEDHENDHVISKDGCPQFPGRRGRHLRSKSRPRLIGAVMFALAFAGLVAIFNAIQESETSNPSSSNLQEIPRETGLSFQPQEEKRQETRTDGRADDTESDQMENKADVAAPSSRGGKAFVTPEMLVRDGLSKDEQEGASSTAAAAKPNVFFIMVDDMGWNDIGYQSTDMARMTPNLDRLAASGVKLTNYYTMSICTPARASLMTGRYVVRYGLQYNVIQPGAPWGLPVEEKIMPQYMKDAGYETHMIGKWHIGSYTYDHIPSSRGFDTFLGYLNDEEMYWSHQSWTAKLHGRKFFDFGYGNGTGYYDIIDRSYAPMPKWPDDDGDDSTGATSTLSSSGGLNIKGKYSTTVFQERALEVIEGKTPYDENPLFLYLAHQAVHDPLGVPPNDVFDSEDFGILKDLEESTSSTLRVRFAKVLMYLDKTIGNLVDFLDAEGWLDNSIIVVASDNGGCPSKGGSNYPLRGIKHSYWEGGTKVPAFVYSPSHIPEELWGSEYSGLMHVIDWLPTLASAANFDLTGSAGELDGIDHWQYLTNSGLLSSGLSPRKELLYNFDPYILWADDDSIEPADYHIAQGAYRQGNWKYTFNEWCSGYYTFDTTIQEQDELTNSSNTCVVLGECSDCGKSCLTYANTTSWLFDLENDPREENNLVDLYPEMVDTMRKRIHDIVFKEYRGSLYEDVKHSSYYVWAKNNWWMIPWYEVAMSGSDERGIFDCSTSLTSTSDCFTSSWISEESEASRE